jgi:hypothetical protein
MHVIGHLSEVNAQRVSIRKRDWQSLEDFKLRLKLAMQWRAPLA